MGSKVRNLRERPWRNRLTRTNDGRVRVFNSDRRYGKEEQWSRARFQ
jgi:hypothetical protein